MPDGRVTQAQGPTFQAWRRSGIREGYLLFLRFLSPEQRLRASKAQQRPFLDYTLWSQQEGESPLITEATAQHRSKLWPQAALNQSSKTFVTGR